MKIKICTCSCGCKLTSDDILFDEIDLCILCDKGNRSDLNDELGRYLKNKEKSKN